jgi:hypothetical protein
MKINELEPITSNFCQLYPDLFEQRRAPNSSTPNNFNKLATRTTGKMAKVELKTSIKTSLKSTHGCLFFNQDQNPAAEGASILPNSVLQGDRRYAPVPERKTLRLPRRLRRGE